jgi:hypothetical protein
MTHFLITETTTLSSIRLSDLEEFEHFFERVRGVRRGPHDPLATREITMRFRVFRIFLQTTVELISKRSDIDRVTFDQIALAACWSSSLPRPRR